MGKSRKDATLEACAGALQNLTASKGLVRSPRPLAAPHSPALPRVASDTWGLGASCCRHSGGPGACPAVGRAPGGGRGAERASPLRWTPRPRVPVASGCPAPRWPCLERGTGWKVLVARGRPALVEVIAVKREGSGCGRVQGKMRQNQRFWGQTWFEDVADSPGGSPSAGRQPATPSARGAEGAGYRWATGG